MSKEQEYSVTLKGGAISVTDLEISADTAAKIMRLVMPLSGNGTTATDAPINAIGGEPIPTGMSARQFMAVKQPKGDIERITCLAFYLSQFKGVSQFKTLELTHLNTEAAQPRFSNASVAARNAVTQQYLALAGGGKKQLSPRGEAVVNALPDRSGVKTAMERYPLHGNKHKNSKKRQKAGK